MVELTWGEIRDQTFISILQQLIHSKLPFEVAIRILNVSKKVNSEIALAKSMFDRLEQQYTKVVQEEGKPAYRKIVEETKEEFETEYKKAISHQFQIQGGKIHSSYLRNVELTIGQLLAIKPLLEDADQIAGLDVLDQAPQEASAPQVQ